MTYEEYVQLAGRASQLVEQGDYKGAAVILQQLVTSDISDVDKSMMCLNLAIVYARQGRVEQALAWYDEGMDYERPHGRFYVAEQKAAYLAAQGRYEESRNHYQDLLGRAELTEGDRARIEENITRLANK